MNSSVDSNLEVGDITTIKQMLIIEGADVSYETLEEINKLQQTSKFKSLTSEEVSNFRISIYGEYINYDLEHNNRKGTHISGAYYDAYLLDDSCKEYVQIVIPEYLGIIFSDIELETEETILEDNKGKGFPKVLR